MYFVIVCVCVYNFSVFISRFYDAHILAMNLNKSSSLVKYYRIIFCCWANFNNLFICINFFFSSLICLNTSRSFIVTFSVSAFTPAFQKQNEGGGEFVSVDVFEIYLCVCRHGRSITNPILQTDFHMQILKTHEIIISQLVIELNCVGCNVYLVNIIRRMKRERERKKNSRFKTTFSSRSIITV